MSINKKAIFLGLATLLVVGGVFTILQATHTTHFFQSASEKQTKQATQYQHDQKAATVTGNGNPSSANSKGDPTASTGTYTPPNNADNITITPVQQGSQIVITTKLTGYSDGNCALTITNLGRTYSQNVQIIYQPQFATCAGFTVPVSSLGGGKWNIVLAVTSGGVTTNQSTLFTVQ